MIDSSNSNGSMEFNIAGMESDFFPIRVEFVSTKTYSHIEVCVCVCVCGQREMCEGVYRWGGVGCVRM